MRIIQAVLATVAIGFGLALASPVQAQSKDDQLSLDKCVGYEACRKIQDKIDALKAGAGNLANKASNALTPSDNRSYFEKFTLDERKEAMAQCQKNFAGRNCEVSYLTPEEIAALRPKKAVPPSNPAADRAWEKQQLEKLDKDVSGILDIKCFTPEMANGVNYGDCAAALTQLNRIEKDARAIGLTLRSSALAQQFGFSRNADGIWNDKYVQGSVPERQAEVVPQKREGVTQEQHDACFNNGQIAACTAMVQAGVDLYGSYANRCVGYLHQGLYDQAIADCTQALTLNPNSADAYRARGSAYLKKNLVDRTIADESRAIAIEPSALAYIARALAHVIKGPGDKQAAIADFRAALRLAPGQKQAVEWLARFGVGPEEATTATSAAPGLNGIWLGRESGNRVRQELRSDGLYVLPATQNPGQVDTGLPYRASGRGSYKYQFPDGHYSVIEILGPGRLRVTNPDGWTDTFDRVGP